MFPHFAFSCLSVKFNETANQINMSTPTCYFFTEALFYQNLKFRINTDYFWIKYILGEILFNVEVFLGEFLVGSFLVCSVSWLFGVFC